VYETNFKMVCRTGFVAGWANGLPAGDASGDRSATHGNRYGGADQHERASYGDTGPIAHERADVWASTGRGDANAQAGN